MVVNMKQLRSGLTVWIIIHRTRESMYLFAHESIFEFFCFFLFHHHPLAVVPVGVWRPSCQPTALGLKNVTENCTCHLVFFSPFSYFFLKQARPSLTRNWFGVTSGCNMRFQTHAAVDNPRDCAKHTHGPQEISSARPSHERKRTLIRERLRFLFLLCLKLNSKVNFSPTARKNHDDTWCETENKRLNGRKPTSCEIKTAVKHVRRATGFSGKSLNRTRKKRKEKWRITDSSIKPTLSLSAQGGLLITLLTVTTIRGIKNPKQQAQHTLPLLDPCRPLLIYGEAPDAGSNSSLASPQPPGSQRRPAIHQARGWRQKTTPSRGRSVRPRLCFLSETPPRQGSVQLPPPSSSCFPLYFPQVPLCVACAHSFCLFSRSRKKKDHVKICVIFPFKSSKLVQIKS